MQNVPTVIIVKFALELFVDLTTCYLCGCLSIVI